MSFRHTDFETIRDDISDDGQPAASSAQELLEASLKAYEFTLDMPTEDDDGDKMGGLGGLSRKSGDGSGGHRSGNPSHGHKRDKNTVREGRSSREGGYAGARSPTSGHHSSAHRDSSGHRDSAAPSSSHSRLSSRHNSNVGTPTGRRSLSGASTPTGGRTPREGTLPTHPLNIPSQHSFNTPFSYPLHTPSIDNIFKHPCTTPSQHTLSTYPMNTL